MTKLEKFYLQIVSKYFTKASTFSTFAIINKKCQDVLGMFHYNPIRQHKFFPNIETQYVYDQNDYDESIELHHYCPTINFDDYMNMKDKYDTFSQVKFTFSNSNRKTFPSNLILPSFVKFTNTWAFSPLTQVTSVVLMDGIRELSENCFNECYQLKQITLPNTLTSLPYGTFFNTTRLSALTIPSSVTKIDKMIFNISNGIESLKIYGTTEVYENFFEYLTKLTSFKVIGNRPLKCNLPLFLTELMATQNVIVDKIYYGEGDIKKAAEEKKKQTNGNEILRTVEIPDNVDEISGNAFRNYQYLTQIIISNNVTKIGARAFMYNSGLKTIKLPSALRNIEDSTFAGCYQLKDIIIPKECSALGNNVFEGCNSLQRVVVRGNIKYINYNVFYSCSSLRELIFHQKFPQFHNEALMDCKQLAFIYSLRDLSNEKINYQIGRCLLRAGYTTISMTFTRNDIRAYQTMNPHYIANGYIRKLELQGISKLGAQLCNGWTKLEEVSLDGPITELPKKCFNECRKLTRVSLPSSIKIINNRCFRNCVNLTEINLPANISLFSKCFDGCTELKTITCSGKILSIGKNCFEGCIKLTNEGIQVGEMIERCYVNSFVKSGVDEEKMMKEWEEKGCLFVGKK